MIGVLGSESIEYRRAVNRVAVGVNVELLPLEHRLKPFEIGVDNLLWQLGFRGYSKDPVGALRIVVHVHSGLYAEIAVNLLALSQAVSNLAH